jgi:2-C-methyl-D-erythritol 4-phosphate cytidylyltransferase
MEGVDKILAPLGGDPILLHALRPLQHSDQVDEIVIVTREDLMVKIGTLCAQRGITKVRRVVKGGDTRTQSVLAGIHEVSPQADLIAIHDGARPFLTPQVLEEVLDTARKRGAAAPAIPVKDTIKTASQGVVTGTPDRATLFAVQTPQVFEASLIRGALTKAQEEGAALTDDCSAVGRLGFPVCLTQGSEDNIKITTPRDLIHGEAILAERMGL